MDSSDWQVGMHPWIYFISRSAKQRLPFFQVLKSVEVFSMGGNPTTSIRRAQTIFDLVDSSLPTFARGSYHIVCTCLSFHCKCSFGPREVTRQIQETNVSTLCLWSNLFFLLHLSLQSLDFLIPLLNFLAHIDCSLFSHFHSLFEFRSNMHSGI